LLSLNNGRLYDGIDHPYGNDKRHCTAHSRLRVNFNVSERRLRENILFQEDKVLAEVVVARSEAILCQCLAAASTDGIELSAPLHRADGSTPSESRFLAASLLSRALARLMSG
jgi:hypothetical protein